MIDLLSRRAPRVAAALTALVALVGCLQTDTKTTILADGSGTLTETTVVDVVKTKDLVAQIKQMRDFFVASQGSAGGTGGTSDVRREVNRHCETRLR